MFENLIRVYETEKYFYEVIEEDVMHNPREYYTHITHLLFKTKHIDLSDEELKDIDLGDFNGWDAVEDYLYEEFKVAYITPVYMMDHSYITLGARPFGGYYGRFDSGQVGFLFVTEEDKEKYNIDRQKFYEMVEYELTEFENYLNGFSFGLYRRDKSDPDILEFVDHAFTEEDIIAILKELEEDYKELDVDKYKDKFTLEVVYKEK